MTVEGRSSGSYMIEIVAGRPKVVPLGPNSYALQTLPAGVVVAAFTVIAVGWRRAPGGIVTVALPSLLTTIPPSGPITAGSTFPLQPAIKIRISGRRPGPICFPGSFIEMLLFEQGRKCRPNPVTGTENAA
jgi:hypothetical protein